MTAVDAFATGAATGDQSQPTRAGRALANAKSKLLGSLGVISAAAASIAAAEPTGEGAGAASTTSLHPTAAGGGAAALLAPADPSVLAPGARSPPTPKGVLDVKQLDGGWAKGTLGAQSSSSAAAPNAQGGGASGRRLPSRSGSSSRDVRDFKPQMPVRGGSSQMIIQRAMADAAAKKEADVAAEAAAAAALLKGACHVLLFFWHACPVVGDGHMFSVDSSRHGGRRGRRGRAAAQVAGQQQVQGAFDRYS